MRKVEFVPAKKTDSLSSAFPFGTDRLLVCTSSVVVELDWTGKEHAKRYQRLKGETIYFAVPAESGNILVCRAVRQKSGIIELDSTGKEVGTVKHRCPISVQELANGNLLVGGGWGEPSVEFDRKSAKIRQFADAPSGIVALEKSQ